MFVNGKIGEAAVGDHTSKNDNVNLAPTLDDLAAAPDLAATLPPAVAATLLTRARIAAAALEGQVLAALVRKPAPIAAKSPAAERLGADDYTLDADAAAALLHKSRRWLFAHKDSLPFVRKVSRKVLLCSRSGLRRWLNEQRP